VADFADRKRTLTSLPAVQPDYLAREHCHPQPRQTPTYEEVVTLPVKQAELDDILATGTYQMAKGQTEGKYFFQAAEDAAEFGRQMFG
jgi:hypothetical protein